MSEFFVHPDGSDADSGGISDAFQTIQTGINAATSPGDIVSVIHDPLASDPKHYISASLVCNSSGTPLLPIMIRGVDTLGNPLPATRPKIEVTGSAFDTFTGSGLYVEVSDVDLGAFNNPLFGGLSHWVVMRCRQVPGPSGFHEPFGSYFAFGCGYCLFIDCEQLVSRNKFSATGNTNDSNLYLRCYSKYGFNVMGERKTSNYRYCIAHGATVGYNLNMSTYNSVGCNLHGCIALDCGKSVTTAHGAVVLSNMLLLNSAGNAIEMQQTGANGGYVHLMDSIIMNSGGYGIERTHTTCQMLNEERNIFYNNTSGHIDRDRSINTAGGSLIIDPSIDTNTLRLLPTSDVRRRLMEIAGDTSIYQTFIDAGSLYSGDVSGIGDGGIWLPNKRGNKQ